MLISGWGSVSENGPYSETLKAAWVISMNLQECQRLYGYGDYSPITDTMLCAGKFISFPLNCIFFNYNENTICKLKHKILFHIFKTELHNLMSNYIYRILK